MRRLGRCSRMRAAHARAIHRVLHTACSTCTSLVRMRASESHAARRGSAWRCSGAGSRTRGHGASAAERPRATMSARRGRRIALAAEEEHAGAVELEHGTSIARRGRRARPRQDRNDADTRTATAARRGRRSARRRRRRTWSRSRTLPRAPSAPRASRGEARVRHVDEPSTASARTQGEEHTMARERTCRGMMRHCGGCAHARWRGARTCGARGVARA